MNIREQIQPIVLRYQESGWTEKTVDCLIVAGFDESDIVYADRNGTGNMSAAFNRAFADYYQLAVVGDNVKPFTWFLTNVEFPEKMPELLLETMISDDEIGAVHPAFDSDHAHIRSTFGIRHDAPFTEWTAPMVRTDLFWANYLDDELPYWGMDIDWSYRIKEQGFSISIDGRSRLDHTYLMNADQKEDVTVQRLEARKQSNEATEFRLMQKYGHDWMAKIWPTHPYLLHGRKNIHTKI